MQIKLYNTMKKKENLLYMNLLLNFYYYIANIVIFYLNVIIYLGLQKIKKHKNAFIN